MMCTLYMCSFEIIYTYQHVCKYNTMENAYFTMKCLQHLQWNDVRASILIHNIELGLNDYDSILFVLIIHAFDPNAFIINDSIWLKKRKKFRFYVSFSCLYIELI